MSLPRFPNLPAAIYMGLFSVSSFCTAILMLSGGYNTFGLQQILNKDGDTLNAGGLEIWGLNQLFMLLSALFMLMGLGCMLWLRWRGKSPSMWLSMLLLPVALFLLITFYPRPFEFQLRYYQGPAFATYVLLAQDSGDFIDGNEDRFYGQMDKRGVETYYLDNGESRYFDCITERNWWWGKLAVHHGRYFILDANHHLALLQQYCKPTAAPAEAGEL
ncbi:hypothetical protein [Leeia sp.]|uniref:hypothetical protein n=1 Tax=Leeia sp. TaxID=2884678 RepID=UPI0035AD854E